MSKAKILVVDDNAFICQLLESRLKAHDYDVISAIDGLEGFKKAKDEKPDLILLDINMPRMNGLETGRRLKADEQTKTIPIIMVTVERHQKIILQAKTELEVAGYITKPFRSEVLMEEVRKALEKKVDQ